jgi:predicted dithiol-disulfide oxidoreductase (DUF899 family)
MPTTVKTTELFTRGNNPLILYFMYGLDRDMPCAGYTHLLDRLDGVMRNRPT